MCAGRPEEPRGGESGGVAVLVGPEYGDPPMSDSRPDPDEPQRGGRNSPYQRAVTAQMGRRNRQYPSWIDENGEDRALSRHPSYEAARWVLRYGHEVVSEWRDNRGAFVLELTAEIGFRPSPDHDIKPIDSTLPVGPGNVVWLAPHEQEPLRDRLPPLQRALAGDAVSQFLVAAWDHARATSGSASDSLSEARFRNSIANEQRAAARGVHLCDCLVAIRYRCGDCEQLERADNPPRC